MGAIKRVIFIIPFILVLVAMSPAYAGQVMLDEARSQAIINAINQFQKDGYVSNGYRIIVRDKADTIEIVFLPPTLSGKDLFTKTPPDLPEVHYYLDLSGKRVIRRLLGM